MYTKRVLLERINMEQLPRLDLLTSSEKDQLILYLFSTVQKLEKKVEELEKEVLSLKNQLKNNSQNSSKPPSSDGFKKISKLKVKSENLSGGQRGHKGFCLGMVQMKVTTLGHLHLT